MILIIATWRTYNGAPTGNHGQVWPCGKKVAAFHDYVTILWLISHVVAHCLMILWPDDALSISGHCVTCVSESVKRILKFCRARIPCSDRVSHPTGKSTSAVKTPHVLIFRYHIIIGKWTQIHEYVTAIMIFCRVHCAVQKRIQEGQQIGYFDGGRDIPFLQHALSSWNTPARLLDPPLNCAWQHKTAPICNNIKNVSGLIFEGMFSGQDNKNCRLQIWQLVTYWTNIWG